MTNSDGTIPDFERFLKPKAPKRFMGAAGIGLSLLAGFILLVATAFFLVLGGLLAYKVVAALLG